MFWLFQNLTSADFYLKALETMLSPRPPHEVRGTRAEGPSEWWY